jgi:indole-3-acetate monooxygenase
LDGGSTLGGGRSHRSRRPRCCHGEQHPRRRQAQVVDGEFRIDGRWSLVSGCELGSWMVLLCAVHEHGKPRLTPRGAPETRFMLLPAGDCEIIDTWTVGGLRGTGSHDVAVRDVFVSSAYGSGFTDPYLLPEPRYRIPPFSRVVPGLGAMALGIARTAIDTLIKIAVDKTPERTTQRLREITGPKLGCPRPSRWCARRGSFCSTASIGCGPS